VISLAEPRPRRRDRPDRRLTSEQERAIRVVACLTLLHGRAPTLEEIASALGCSKPAASKRLRYMEKKGLCEQSARSVTELGLRSAVGLGLPRAPIR
jgi:DNA-binding MarR family transcriptional regulator